MIMLTSFNESNAMSVVNTLASIVIEVSANLLLTNSSNINPGKADDFVKLMLSTRCSRKMQIDPGPNVTKSKA